MESVLRSQEVDQIEALWERAYNLDSDVLFFPVRHHSPACAYHLKKTIAAYQPEVILIEGPSDASGMIKYLADNDSKAPFCIYYSYSDSKGLVGEKGGKYRCYYPFLDYSPELVAIREARQRGIEAVFIDLPYPQILIHSGSGKGLRKDGEKKNYNDEHLMAHSRFIRALCEKEGCRSYSELWEKLFEIDGLSLSSAAFVKNMLASCFFSRISCREEELVEDGCIAREIFMAERIKEAKASYKKILVVTGGFHTSGLLELMDKKEKIKLHKIDESDFGAYAMAYSFEESDQLSGYASGMPHPAFYQKVWDFIGDKAEKPYESAVLHFVVRSGSNIRKQGGVLSTADEIEAFNMAKGLTMLRNKGECGVYELMDAVKTCFVKGELTAATDGPLRTLFRLLMGKRIGALCGSAEVPPIVKDFREALKHFKLKSGTSAEQEIVLDIYKTKKHRELSKLFHQLMFLNTGFCRRIKGPDFLNRRDTNLVRETWKYKWNVAVESRLIELSVYGGSLQEAAGAVVGKRLAEMGSQSGEAALLLMDCYMMGLEGNLGDMTGKMAKMIAEDSNFESVASCTYHLHFLYHAKGLLDSASDTPIKELVIQAYNKGAFLTPSLYGVSEEQENEVISKLKDIYYISVKNEIGVDSELFAEALLSLSGQCASGKEKVNSAIEGAALGLLFGLNRMEADFITKRGEAYLYGTGEHFIKAAGFLKGLFATARDVVLDDESLVEGINHVVAQIDEESFMKILPNMRLAFSFFSPQEIDGIGKKVAALHGVSPQKLWRLEAVDPEEVKMGQILDVFGTEMLKRWGIIHEA